MTKKRYRDAVTGEYVTEEYAEKHPRRTVGEKIPEHEAEPEVSDEGDPEQDDGPADISPG